MRPSIRRLFLSAGLPLTFASLAFLQYRASAQDRLKEMPGSAQYQRVGPQIATAVVPGSVSATWSADSRSFEYLRDGRRYRFSLTDRKVVEIGDSADSRRTSRDRLDAPERGRQFTLADSPDKAFRARYNERDRNLYLLDQRTKVETAITSDGSRDRRIKYGSASWVYGEELDQTTAMWWSPDGRKLAFYRFDEANVPDYFLQLDQTRLQSAVDTEAYPKAGAPNPVVDLLVYDVQTKRTTKVDVRSGQPLEDSAVGYYAYQVAWSPDGRELLFNRTNRRQNVLELVAATPDTGEVRVVLREEWPTGWVENTPTMVFLDDGKRFIWESERTGWRNFYLYELSGRLIAPLTAYSTFEAVSIVKIDEDNGVVFVTARDGDNHLKTQLHRVSLDGKTDVRLTDRAFHHIVGSCLPNAARGTTGRGAGCGISPDSRYFVDTYQTHAIPPATRLADALSGATVAEVVASDMSRFESLGLKKAELFTFASADGGTTLHGLIQFPSTFDPSRKYPVLVPVYGGPLSSSNTARETFVAANPLAEYGFLIVNVDSRSAPGRGKRTLDQIYLKLGQVEIDDVAAGVRSLASRRYVDTSRVGIYGTSYGGYVSLMSILRYPALYAAASASSPVTAWNHYDTIYTERYMRTPQENRAGYEAGSAMTYARDLRGRLMLYYGTADNNVHPSNAMQLIDALQRAGKSFDVQVGPDRGHSGINTDRMMEFFIDHLVMRPGGSPSTF